MEITLLHHVPLPIAVKSIRKCWSSEDKSDTVNTNDNIGEKDRALIYRVGIKNRHASTLEHLNYSFDIDGISRACLQELARHRIASLSVKSSRYTLKELKDEQPFCSDNFDYKGHLTGKEDAIGSFDDRRASNYLVWTGNKRIDISSVVALENLRIQLSSGISNDLAKYCLPESYQTSLVWTVNARSLQNFLALRTNKAALWEIRELAYNIFEALPSEHRYLFEGFLYEDK